MFRGVATAGRVLRFSGRADNPALAGLWDRGDLARFLDFFISLPHRVNERPTPWGRTAYGKDSRGKTLVF